MALTGKETTNTTTKVTVNEETFLDAFEVLIDKREESAETKVILINEILSTVAKAVVAKESWVTDGVGYSAMFKEIFLDLEGKQQAGALGYVYAIIAAGVNLDSLHSEVGVNSNEPDYQAKLEAFLIANNTTLNTIQNDAVRMAGIIGRSVTDTVTDNDAVRMAGIDGRTKTFNTHAKTIAETVTVSVNDPVEVLTEEVNNVIGTDKEIDDIIADLSTPPKVEKLSFLTPPPTSSSNGGNDDGISTLGWVGIGLGVAAVAAIGYCYFYDGCSSDEDVIIADDYI